MKRFKKHFHFLISYNFLDHTMQYFHNVWYISLSSIVPISSIITLNLISLFAF